MLFFFEGAMTTASFENFKRLSTGKDDNIWAQPPQALSQAIGDSFYVVVTHLQSPSDIIVQKVENASKRDSLFNSEHTRCKTWPRMSLLCNLIAWNWFLF